METFRKAAEAHLDDDPLSNFTIVCEGKEFKMHRFFICAHSKWFERCCSGSLCEARLQRVELKEDRLDAVKLMIDFFYKWDYDDKVTVDPKPPPDDPESGYSTHMNAYMYAIADKYEIIDLKGLALEKSMKVAIEHSAHLNMALLVSTTYTIYGHIMLPATDKKLKKHLVDMWALSESKVLKKVSSETMIEFLTPFPGFATVFLYCLIRNPSENVTHICKDCNGYEQIAKSELATKGFKCGVCGSTQSLDNVLLTSIIGMKKHW